MEAVTGVPLCAGAGAGGAAAALRPGGAAADLGREDAGAERRSPPPRALAVSALSLLAAAVVGIVWPRSVTDYSGFVWILALVPLFLLSYYRGWKGAALASVAAMLALVAVELVVVRMSGRTVDWWVLGSVTGLLILVTLGAGWLSEILLRQRSLAMRMAYRDPLTGLANRRLLREHAEKAMARADREEAVNAGVIFMDLIRFKRINDEFGHHAGDEALTEVASRLQSAMRGSDTVARVGGDEFAVLLAGELGVQDVVAVAQRVQERISLP
ncbi:MAG: diguanylate cyclase domain-containing protein, partial [Gemmatimonadota bacterium]